MPLKERYGDARFTEDRAIWTGELWRHCEEDYDEKEMTEKQEERISQFNTEGDRQFTQEERTAEKTIDSVLRARARLAEETINGPEDSVVAEMIKELTQEKTFEFTKCFQAQAHFTCRWC